MLRFKHSLRSIVIVSLLFFSASRAWGEKPFWRVKPKILQRIVDGREIIVSVKAEEKKRKKGRPQEPSRLMMNGGGAVKTPVERAFREAQNYENLKTFGDYVREVHYTPKTKELYLHTQAFDYHARMRMKLKPEELASGEKRLGFEIVAGSFKGMKGAFTFEGHKPTLTLMGFEAEYEYTELPMPRFFIQFGLEVILQKMAGKMRAFLEKDAAP